MYVCMRVHVSVCGTLIDTYWKKKTGKTQRNMEEDSRVGNPRGQSELGGGAAWRSWQKTDSSGDLWLQPCVLLSMNRD